MKRTYTAILHPFENGYLLRVPDLPGCITSGKTIQRAGIMATDALSACLLVLKDEGQPLPPAIPPELITFAPDEILLLVQVDTSFFLV